MLKNKYKLLVIGAGSGGLACARRAATFIEDVAVVEHKKPGGTCVNLGCIPKKILWNYGVMKKELEFFAEAGILLDSPRLADWATLKQKKQAWIHHLNENFLANLKKEKVEFVKGFAEFIDPQTVRIGDQKVNAENVVIAVGSKPKVPNIPGAHLGLTSDDYFSLERLPKSMVVIGGGYIGLETASTLLNFGVQVDVVMIEPFALDNQDHEASNFILKCLEKRGLRVHRSSTVTSLQKQDGQSSITVNLKDKPAIQTEGVLWAIGRDSNIQNLSLEKAGVQLGKEREVLVDQNYRTTSNSVFAIGDCINRIRLTPVAIREGRVLAENLFNPKKPNYHVDYEYVPTVVFTDPPYASCGLSEEQAKKKFGEADVEVYKATAKNLQFATVQENRREDLLFKMIGIKSQNKRIVGVHMVGKTTDEMIQLAGVLLKMGATKQQFDAAIAVHPTLAEELVLLPPHHL